MTAIRLLHPREIATRKLVTAKANAFRMGPHIAPHRAAYEFYPTPPEATRALLSVETFDGPIWEPACGEGHISKVLTDAGYDVVSTDLIDYGYGEGKRDFLAETRPLAKHIVTNPPYGKGLADAFAKHALKLTRETGGTVAMLMNLIGALPPPPARLLRRPPARRGVRARRVHLLAVRRPSEGNHEHRQAEVLLDRVEAWAPRPDDTAVALDQTSSGRVTASQ